MLNKKDEVKVRNLTGQRVAYLIPERNIRRDFSQFESKDITVEELRELWYKSGGRNLLQHYLCVENQELAAEFGIDEDEYTHEYTWTQEDIDRVLTEPNTQDELQDALDYAPIGIVETLVSEAVRLKIADITKRDIIQQATGKNITKMIDYQTSVDDGTSAEPVVQTNSKRRRRAK